MQRQHPRYSGHIRLSVGTDDGNERQLVRTKDLSLGGACFYSDVAFPFGATLILYVPWVVDSGGEPSDRVESIAARVVWVTSIDSEFQIGVRFTPLNGAAKRCVEAVCEVLEVGAGEAPKANLKRMFDLS